MPGALPAYVDSLGAWLVTSQNILTQIAEQLLYGVDTPDNAHPVHPASQDFNFVHL
jgi:hypothetical protein